MDFQKRGLIGQPSGRVCREHLQNQPISTFPAGGEGPAKGDRSDGLVTDFANVYASDLLPAGPGAEITEHFLLEVVDIILAYIRKTYDEKSKILDFHHPHQLLEGLDGFSLAVSDQPEPLEQILVDCRDTLKYGVKTGHPRFFNQLSSGLDMVGLAGAWLTATANTNMFTYEISPVFVVMEKILLQKMHELVGWAETGADGIFSPGGAISNLYSVLAARYKYFPEVKSRGMAALPRIVLFISEHSHYSVKKAAAVLGIGTDNVIEVKCDERGKMIPSELEERILQAKREGQSPLYVSATAGTTVYGAIDPLTSIADICERHKLWMHVDGLLKACNQMCASYLFQPDKQYDTAYDTGDKAVQCGRHVDVFKLWLMWKAKGTCGFELQIDRCLELADYLHKSLKKRDDFELVVDAEPELTNVCFWYVPPSLRSLPQGSERAQKLHKIAPQIKALLVEEGTAMVSYQPHGDKANFFRMVFSNPATRQADVDFLVGEIERLGKAL
uniref:Glutamate decarboxylase 1 n=1 Tax=Ornithorhynchus anatinus TaxID=9258 RepID=A0A6I8PC86_ORNAN